MARAARRAANSLNAAGELRSCISRCYYAAYSAVTGELLKASPGIQFRNGRRNPYHEDLPRYVKSNLPHLDDGTRRQLAKHVRFLREARVTADYRPHLTVDTALATRSLSLALSVFRDLGVKP